MSLREWIKFRIRLKGETLRSFGQRHGVTAGSVGVVFYRPYPRMEKLLGDFLETEPWILWPARYTDQKPNRRNRWYGRSRRKHSMNFDVNQKNLDKDNHETD
jgi:lambda repressor-like predicted transcriptional regulator